VDSIDKLKTRKVLAAILSQVSALMLGIGLFAYFGDGDVLHPLLTNMVVVWALILVGGFFLMMIYPLSIFLPIQRCPHCNKWFSLPKLVDQKGDRERVQCRRCHQVWERFSYRGGVSAGGDVGDVGGDGGSVG